MAMYTSPIGKPQRVDTWLRSAWNWASGRAGLTS
jgi:hypothetical protein